EALQLIRGWSTPNRKLCVFCVTQGIRRPYARLAFVFFVAGEIQASQWELSMRSIQGAVAVVTGAGSGIGRALAVQLGAQGAELALADVNAAALDETRKLVGTVKARTYNVDVAQAAAVESLALAVQRDFGRASLLINNAGVALFGTFAELTLAEMEWLIRINFWGVIHGCKFFLPLLEREPEAHVVNISSV